MNAMLVREFAAFTISGSGGFTGSPQAGDAWVFLFDRATGAMTRRLGGLPGAFTKGLIEGLIGKADYKGTGRITVNMPDLYVSERVKELTEGQQTPTMVKPPNVPDFPVAVLR